MRRSLRHHSSYVLAVVALVCAALVGILLPLVSGGNRGVADPNWTPPVRTAGVTTALSIAPTDRPAEATPTVAATNTARPAPLPTSTVPAPTATVTVAPMARIVKGPANLRAGPDTRFGIIGVAKAGDQLRITGRSEDGLWVQVCCIAEAPAWVSAQLLELPAALDKYPIVH